MRIGIIGSGRIANRFWTEMDHVDEVLVSSVYNPHDGSAAKFVAALQDSVVKDVGSAVRVLSLKKLPKPVDDLEDFWDLVDAVYVASPHGTHFEYTIQALEHKKHVICEKPMAFTVKEAKEAFKLAKKNKVVLMEGLKTGYMPGFLHLLDVVKSGVIGDVKDVRATFTKLMPEDSRELSDGEVAGSFLELGTYGMLAVFTILGIDFKDVSFDVLKNKKGVDVYTTARFTYKDAFASATAGLGVKCEGTLVIAGTNGYIVVDAPWWLTKHFEVYIGNSEEPANYDDSLMGKGLRYEVEHFVKVVNGEDDGIDYEQISVKMAEVMEGFRKI